MRHKITLLTAAVVLAFLACVTPRAFAQTFEATHASGLILAGGGTDPVHTLTISVASLGSASTLTLPGGNVAGVLTNPGNGMLTWTPLSLSSLPTEAANTLLGNPTGSTAATTTITLGTGLAFNTGALTISGTLPTGLILNDETIGGSTTINTSGSITGGAGSFTTLNASGNASLDASPSSGGTVVIGNTAGPSTTTVNGAVTFTGTVTLPAGAVNSSSLGLAKNDIFIGDATSANADTAMMTQDVTLQNTSTHVAQATVNGSHATTFAVANAETVGGTTTLTGATTLGKAGPSGTNGVLTLDNSTNSNQTTIQPGTAPLATYIYQLPAQPNSLPTAGNVLTIGTPTGSSPGPYTVPLTWSPAATGTVTASSSLVTNAPTYATGASAIATTATALTNGQLLIGSTSNPPVPATLSTTTGISITPGAGSLTINNTGVTSFTANGTGLTPTTAATGAVALGGALNTTTGGTGVSNPTAHDLLVAEGATAMNQVSGAAGTVLIGNGSSTDPSFSAAPTLGVPGATAGTLTLASGAAAFSTTVQTSATTPASTYIYQLPAQPTGLPTAGDVLTIGAPTGTGPYTVPLTWTVPNSTTGVLYDQTTEQATVPISSTPATPSFLFNVGYNNTVVADSAAGAIINSINTNTTAANAPLHNADGFTVNVTATGSGTFYGNATGLIVNATAPVGGIPTGVAVTINGDSIGPAFQLHNKTPGSFYGARSIISTVDSDLEFKETGDKYGTSILDIQNRTGSNGALFQTISNAADTGTDVIDWGFIPGNGTQSNIRLEARHKWAVTPYTSNEYLRSSANITSASPEEFQYFFGTTGATPLYTLSIGENATLLERGNFGIGYGTNSPGGDTAQGSPRVRLDVHSPGSYYGNLSDVGYSGASNILLSDTGTSSITAPFVGAMEFQGTNDGISSFAAGAEASRYINYTWPTLSTAPTANQVLSISTISGSGTLATPYLAQLTWATASGSSTGVNYNVATGSPQNTATTTNDLFNVAYTAASGTSATLPGAVITANASGATTTGVATGLSITTTGKGTSGTATGLNLTTTGASTASNNIDISGTNNNWTISALGEITFGTAGTSSAPNITSTAGTAMYVQAGTSTTTNAVGPAVTLQAGTGNGTGIGGGLELWGGTPGATSGNAAGGFASLDGANSADGIGGADSVNAGNGGTNGAGGTVYVAAGNGAGAGIGGAVLVTGGIGGSTGAGGAATIQGGTGGTAGAGGLTTIEGGNGTGTSQAAGGLTLNGGRSTGTASGSTITFQAAPAGGTSNATLNSLIAAATMSATSTTAAQLEIGNTNGGASGISGSLILANTGHQDSTIIQPSATTPTLNYTYQLPAQTVAAQPSSGYVLTAGTPTGTSPNFTIPLSWSPVSGSSTGVNFNVTTAQTAAVAANNYLFDVGYTNTAVDDSVVGAVITSTNTSTSNGGSSTSNHGATGLTVNATATSSTSFHGNSTAIFANATANTGGTATGLNLNVTGGTTDVDILGTAGWSVSSVGVGTFAGITDAGTTTINNTGTATTQIGNVAGFGNVTIGNSGTGGGSISLLGGTTGSILIGGTAQTGSITLGSSSGTNTVNIGTGAGTTTVNVATGGTGSVAETVNIGSTTGASATNINAGTGIVNINGGVSVNYTPASGSSNYSVSSTDYAIIIGSASTSRTFTWPTSGLVAGRILIVVNNSGHTWTTSAPYTPIGGGMGTTTVSSGTSYTFIYSGSAWFQLQ